MSMFQFNMLMGEIGKLENLKSGKKEKKKTTTEEIIAMAKKRGVTPPKE